MYLSKYILKLIAKYPVLGHVVSPLVRLQNFIRCYWDVLIPIVLLLVLLVTLLGNASASEIEYDTWETDSPPVCWVTIDEDGYETSIDLCTGHSFDCTPYVNESGDEVCR